jgi:DNA-binding NarL/FixJ family response regulator
MPRGRRLALIDNDPAVLELLALDLRLEGHEIVALAGNATEAIAACERDDVEVAVIDLRLGPGLDGLDVARKVRRPDLRIVLHTNYVNPATVERANLLGVTVVEKGTLSTLRRAINGEAG